MQCEILKICYLISNSEKNAIVFVLHYLTLIYLFLQGLRLNTRAFASRKSVKKLRRDGPPPKSVVDSPPTKHNYVQDDNHGWLFWRFSCPEFCHHTFQEYSASGMHCHFRTDSRVGYDNSTGRLTTFVILLYFCL